MSVSSEVTITKELKMFHNIKTNDPSYPTIRKITTLEKNKLWKRLIKDTSISRRPPLLRSTVFYRPRLRWEKCFVSFNDFILASTNLDKNNIELPHPITSINILKRNVSNLGLFKETYLVKETIFMHFELILSCS